MAAATELEPENHAVRHAAGRYECCSRHCAERDHLSGPSILSVKITLLPATTILLR
jgi:hypothetical protein